MKLRGDDAKRYLDALDRETACMDFLIPEKISLRPVLHGRMDGGGSVYLFRNEEYKINVTTSRASRNAPSKDVYTCDDLPSRQFNTFRELRVAMAEWRQQQ